MGFTKRYYSKELILKQIENNFPLKMYFIVDGCIFTDELSHQAYEMSMEGHSDEEIKEVLLNNLLIEQI